MPKGIPGSGNAATKRKNKSLHRANGADKAARLTRDALRWINAGDYELARLMLRRADEILSPLE